MLNKRLETRSLQKKYVIFFLLLGLVVSGFLCLAYRVSIATQPVSDQTENQPVLISKDNQQTLFKLESRNVFQIRLPYHALTPLVSSSGTDEQTTKKIVISDVTINNVFGGAMSFHNLNIDTRLIDFINTSRFLDTNLNVELFEESLPQPLAVLYFFCLGIMISLIGFGGLFLIDNVLKFACVVVSHLAKVVEHQCRAVIVINSILLLVMIVLSIWACYSGILYADDGFFNLMAEYPQDVLAGLPSTYYQITHLLFLLAGGKLVTFRIFTVLSSILSTLLLGIVVVQYMRCFFKYPLRGRDGYTLFILLLIANGIQFSHHLTPDYNNLSRIVVYGQVSILVLVWSGLIKKALNLIWSTFFLGLITGANFFIKFPEAISSAVVISVLLAIRDKRSFWKLLGIFYFGIVLFVIIYFSAIQDFASFRGMLSNSFHYSKLVSGHQVTALLAGNIRDLVSFSGFLVLFLIIYHWLTQPLRRAIPNTTIALMAIAVISLAVTALKLTMARDYQIAFELWYTPVVKGLLLALATIVYENFRGYHSFKTEEKNQYHKLNLLCLLLLVFTYLASLGTDTKILYHVILHPALILVVIILQWRILDKNSATLSCLLNVLLLLGTFIFVQGIVYNNAIFVNLFKQTVRYKIGQSNIYLSENSVNSLLQIKQKLVSCGYRDGDYIAGYYAMPDIVYALGGRSPVTPWFSPSTKGIDETQLANRYIFSLMNDEVKQRLFVIVNDEKLGSGLATLGFDSPQKLIYCGSVNIDNNNHEFSVRKFSVFHYDFASHQ